MAIDFPQSVTLCLILAAAGGCVEVLATAVLARQDERAKEGFVITKWRYRGALAANTTLQISASILGNLFAPWFGPVSLVGPMFLSAQLVANMIIFGLILGLEFFTKDMKTGTFVIVVAALLLPEVGPQAQYDQDVVALIGTWYSLLWIGVMVFAMMTSSILLNGWDIKALPQKYRVPIILTARSTSFAMNLTVSRVMVLSPNFAYLVVSIALKIISGAVMTHAIVIQSTAVSQAVYVPLNACTLIAINAITGIIVWEDHKAIGSWLGYVCVFVLLLLGTYLLLGDFELFGADNAAYGVAGSWQALRGWNGRKVRQVRRASMRMMGRAEEASLAERLEVAAARSKLVEMEEAAAQVGGGGGAAGVEVVVAGTSSEGDEDEEIGDLVAAAEDDVARLRHSATSTVSEETRTTGNIIHGHSCHSAPGRHGSAPPISSASPSHVTDPNVTTSEQSHQSFAAERHRQAWASVYGLRDPVHREGHHYRERNIFAIDHYYNRHGEIVEVQESGGGDPSSGLHLPGLGHVADMVPVLLRGGINQRPAPAHGEDRTSSAPATTTSRSPPVVVASAASLGSGIWVRGGKPRACGGDDRVSSAPTTPVFAASASSAWDHHSDPIASAPTAAAQQRHRLSDPDVSKQQRSVLERARSAALGSSSPSNRFRPGKLKKTGSTPAAATSRVSGGAFFPFDEANYYSYQQQQHEDPPHRQQDRLEASFDPSLLSAAAYQQDLAVPDIHRARSADYDSASDDEWRAAKNMSSLLKTASASAAASCADLPCRTRSDTEQTGSTAGCTATTVGGGAEQTSWDEPDGEKKMQAAATEMGAPSTSTTHSQDVFRDEEEGGRCAADADDGGAEAARSLDTAAAASASSPQHGGENSANGDLLVVAQDATAAKDECECDDECDGDDDANSKMSRDFRRRISDKAWLLIALSIATVVTVTSITVLTMFRAPDELLEPGAGGASSSPSPVSQDERMRRGYEAIKGALALPPADADTGKGAALEEWPETPSDLLAWLEAENDRAGDDNDDLSTSILSPRFRAAAFALFDDPVTLARDPTSDVWFLQRYALRTLWEATTTPTPRGGAKGGGWYAPWDWLASTAARDAACDLHGIRCDPERRHVTEVLLSSNGLDTSSAGADDDGSNNATANVFTVAGRGGLPDEIALLKRLTTLHLDGNPRLGGPVPFRALRALPELKSATFRGCGLTGAIPPELFGNADDEDDDEDKNTEDAGGGRRSALEFLSLEGNEGLEGPVPAEACDAAEYDGDAEAVVVVNCMRHPCPCCRGPYCEG